jgi:predicted phosphodiesterase
MKRAIISDIHGDVQSLESVLRSVQGRGISSIWCLGDIIGRAGDGIRAWELVRDNCEIVLAGNHDLAVQKYWDDDLLSRFPERDQGAIQIARNSLINDEQYLNLKPETVTYLWDEPIWLGHGGPHDPYWEFMSSPEDITWGHRKRDENILISGHTHSALYADSERSWDRKPKAYPILRGRPCYLNPGAVLHDRRWLEISESEAVWRQAKA